jgi:hypothetical protein
VFAWTDREARKSVLPTSNAMNASSRTAPSAGVGSKPSRCHPLREMIRRARHDGCGGRAARVELLTGIEGASSPRVRYIVLEG